jgi:hypothetical protein
VSRGWLHLPREVFFCFFGLAGPLGGFVAPSGFGLFGDICFSLPFGRLPLLRLYLPAGVPVNADATGVGVLASWRTTHEQASGASAQRLA